MVDYTVVPPKTKITPLKHRRCKISDFTTAEHKNKFKKYEKVGSNLICLDDVNKLQLKGESTTSFVSKSISLDIRKCGGPGCASPYEIDQFIGKLFLMPIDFYEKIDFEKRSGKPTT